jgi:hypothetical protein
MSFDQPPTTFPVSARGCHHCRVYALLMDGPATSKSRCRIFSSEILTELCFLCSSLIDQVDEVIGH